MFFTGFERFPHRGLLRECSQCLWVCLFSYGSCFQVSIIPEVRLPVSVVVQFLSDVTFMFMRHIQSTCIALKVHVFFLFVFYCFVIVYFFSSESVLGLFHTSRISSAFIFTLNLSRKYSENDLWTYLSAWLVYFLKSDCLSLHVFFSHKKKKKRKLMLQNMQIMNKMHNEATCEVHFFGKKYVHMQWNTKNTFYTVNWTESTWFKEIVHAKIIILSSYTHLMSFQTFMTFFCGSQKKIFHASKWWIFILGELCVSPQHYHLAVNVFSLC